MRVEKLGNYQTNKPKMNLNFTSKIFHLEHLKKYGSIIERSGGKLLTDCEEMNLRNSYFSDAQVDELKKLTANMKENHKTLFNYFIEPKEMSEINRIRSVIELQTDDMESSAFFDKFPEIAEKHGLLDAFKNVIKNSTELTEAEKIKLDALKAKIEIQDAQTAKKFNAIW